MENFASNFSYCHSVKISYYIYNITAPYTDDTNHASIIGTSVAMFTLTALFFNLTVFRHHSSTTRIVRYNALWLFLPVMSYLFSEAKNAGGVATPTTITPLGLPLRARLILTWMLLVELLRNKMEPVWVPAGAVMSRKVEHAGRIAWLGSLVFTSFRNHGREAVFGVLWTVAAAKMVQGVVITEVMRRSFAAGRNPEIVGAYTQQIPECRRRTSSHEQHDVTRLQRTSCGFAVAGEENIRWKPGPCGYALDARDTNAGGVVVTVGEIWSVGDDIPMPAKRLCFSFALFKLLRRRFEDTRAHVGADDGEAQACRDLIFNHGRDTDPEELFRVVADEVNFLGEYYYSVAPVVFASPFFLVANYILFPIIVAGICFLTFVACGHGDVPVTFRSMRTDNFVLSVGVGKTAVCLLLKVLQSLAALLSAIDLATTTFLFVAYVYEEVCGFISVVLSDWFVVSLVCTYLQDARRSCRRAIASALQGILVVGRRTKRRQRIRPLNQLDMTRTPFWIPMVLRAVPVPQAAKAAVVKHLAECIQGRGGAAATVRNGESALDRNGYTHLSWACKSASVAQVILTWHIATALFEAKHRRGKGEAAAGRDDSGDTATTLSRYCGYLVAFRPELLPNDWNETVHVYKATARDLKETLGCWGYHCMPEGNRLYKLKLAGASRSSSGKEGSVMHCGAVLGAELIYEVESGRSTVQQLWTVLTELWVELVVYVAPAAASDGNAQLKGHYEALAECGEFVTLLWALATLTGVTREPIASTPDNGGGGAAGPTEIR